MKLFRILAVALAVALTLAVGSASASSPFGTMDLPGGISLDTLSVLLGTVILPIAVRLIPGVGPFIAPLLGLLHPSQPVTPAPAPSPVVPSPPPVVPAPSPLDPGGPGFPDMLAKLLASLLGGLLAKHKQEVVSEVRGIVAAYAPTEAAPLAANQANVAVMPDGALRIVTGPMPALQRLGSPPTAAG